MCHDNVKLANFSVNFGNGSKYNNIDQMGQKCDKIGELYQMVNTAIYGLANILVFKERTFGFENPPTKTNMGHG